MPIWGLAAGRIGAQLQPRRCRAGSFTETELGEVKFPEISTQILEKVCQYFYYKLRYQNSWVARHGAGLGAGACIQLPPARPGAQHAADERGGEAKGPGRWAGQVV